MERVFKYGKMERNMKANGQIIKHKVEEFLFILMEIYMRASSKMIELMGMEYIITRTVQSIRAIGKTI